MLIHGIEIAMFIAGIVTLARGRFNLTAKTIIRGGRAYAVGVILLLTPLFSFGGAVLFLIALLAGNGMVEPAQNQVLLAAGVEFGIIVLAWIPIIIIGVTQPKTPDPWDIPTDDVRPGERPWRRRDDDDRYEGRDADRAPPLPPGERERIRRNDDRTRP